MDRNINQDINRLDSNTISDEEKKDVLFDVISAEVKKPQSEIDMDLIQECSDFAKELLSEEEIFTESELDEKLDEIKKRASVADRVEVKENKAKSRTKFSFKFKAVATVAAVFILLFATLSLVAASSGYDSAIDLIISKISEISKMKPGDSFDVDGVTFTKVGKNTKYENIEGLLRSENIDILFPSVLPEDIRVERITYIDVDGEKYSISFDFIPNSIKFDVDSWCVTNLSLFEGEQTVETKDGSIFYVFDIDGRYYQAIGQINGKEYKIQSLSIEQIKNIIEKLQEINR